MASHRRLLWLAVVLAGLGAALLFATGTANASTGSTSADGSSNPTSSDSSTTTSTPDDSEASSEDPGDTTTPAASTISVAIRPSSLLSAITRARDARLSTTQPQSSLTTSRRVPYTTPSDVPLRPPSARVFDIDTATPALSSTARSNVRTTLLTIASDAIEKTASLQSEPAMQSASLTPADSPPQQPLRTAVLGVLSSLGLSPRPDPPEAAAAVVSPLIVKGQQTDQTIAEASRSGAVVLNSTSEAATELTALLPTVTTETAVDGVVVGHSTLTIPCGPGYDVPADWYFPTGPDPPQGVIWLQHGFLAQGPWYSTTAATLAKETNSIVVVPSITSNFLQCDGCWLNGEPMERAVASMFVDRTALTASASHAAGHPVTLPEKFVLVGHSAGGGFAVAVAGFIAGTPAIADLAGVVMFDGVALNDNMTTSLAKLPDTLPVYQIAAPSYVWNNFGSGTAQLVQARPGQFTGFQLVGGSHVDSMRGVPIIEFAAQLLTGFSRPANVQAVQTLAVGWINDMYAGVRHDGIYADPGQTIKIGGATAIALPTPPTWFTPIETLIRNFVLAVERILFNLIAA